MSTLFDIGPEDVSDTSDDYYTPRWIFDAAGLVFDMDVAAPVDPSRRTCPARRYLTPIEDGLAQPWNGLVWMNPPFSHLMPWVERFTAHANGIALVSVPRPEVAWFGCLMRATDAIAFISTDFIRPDGTAKRIPCLVMLAGIGSVAVAAVGRMAAADKYLQGAYHVSPRRAL